MKQRILFSLLAFLLALAVPAKQKQSNTRTQVELQTEKGTITIELYNETPLHKANFIKLCKEHYFDSLMFHRVIRNFMIQTGDLKSRHAEIDTRLGDGDPGYTLTAEILYPQFWHKRGAVAAARTGDAVNPQRRSSGSQFYIVWGQDFQTEKELDEVLDKISARSNGKVSFPQEVRKSYYNNGGTPWLDGGYTVFGEVVKGLNIVDKIQSVPINDLDRPFADIRIISAKVIEP